MRRNKDGTIHKHSQSLQMQIDEAAKVGLFPPTLRQSWLSMTRQALTDNEYFAHQCHADEALPVVTARAALKLLVEYLERNR